MGDWTSQNWTKRDGRNNQEEQQQQEKKATYKTAAELAVKNWERCFEWYTKCYVDIFCLPSRFCAVLEHGFLISMKGPENVGLY